MKDRKLLFSLTKEDFEIQTFTCGGHGGSKQNCTNSGVRIIHKDSKSVGESREERSQLANRKKAFERLVATDKFKSWHKLKTAYAMMGIQDMEREIEKEVNKAMKEENLKIEYYDPKDKGGKIQR
jgi:protein subunit release factor B